MNHHAEENPAVLALLSEDYLAVDTLIRTVRDLTARSSRRGEDAQLLRVLLFGLERLPLATPGLGVLLILKDEYGEAFSWLELGLGEDEFSLGRGHWSDGESISETVFEVSAAFREGSALHAASFADDFRRFAAEPELAIQVESTISEPFSGWELAKATGLDWFQLGSDF